MNPDLLNRHDIDLLYYRYGQFKIDYVVRAVGRRFYRLGGSHDPEVLIGE